MTRATFMVDLDQLDRFNSARKVPVRQELIYAASWRIVDVFGDDGIIGALGHGRFSINVFNVDESIVQGISTRLHQVLRAPFDINGKDVFISASIGIALASSSASDETIAQDAEWAMHRVKDNGGDATFVLYESSELSLTSAAA